MNEYGAMVEWYWQGIIEVFEENLVPVPLCLPQIPHSRIGTGFSSSFILSVVFIKPLLIRYIHDVYGMKRTIEHVLLY